MPNPTQQSPIELPEVHRDTKLLHPDSEQIMQVRQGVIALQSGDRQQSYRIFSALSQDYYYDANVWIGIALSSEDAKEAHEAVLQAEAIDPASRFVQRAMREVAERFPAGAPTAPQTIQQQEAKPAPVAMPSRGLDRPTVLQSVANFDGEPGEDGVGVQIQRKPGVHSPVNQLSERPVVLRSKPRRRFGRFVATFALFLLTVGIVSSGAYGLWNSSVFQALPITPPEVPATGTAAIPTLAAPVVQAPPTFTPVVAQNSTLGIMEFSPGGEGTAEALISRQEAIRSVRDGQFTPAIAALEAATERDPNDAEALYYLGIAYMGDPARASGPEDATLAFQSLVASRPEWAPGWYMLARSLLVRNLPQDAVAPAHRATDLDASRPEYWLSLSEAYSGSGQAKEAAEAQAEAARLMPAAQITPPATDSSITAILDATPEAPLVAPPTVESSPLPTESASPTATIEPVATVAPAAPTTEATIAVPLAEPPVATATETAITAEATATSTTEPTATTTPSGGIIEIAPEEPTVTPEPTQDITAG